MTDTADPTTLGVDERTASARGFFDVDPLASTAFPPPPTPLATTAVPEMPAAAGAPQLPRVAPAVASQAPTPFAFSPTAAFIPAPAAPRNAKRSGGGARRFVSWLIVLGIIGGAVYAGIMYGPDLMDRAKGDDPTAGEPSAPLAFPAVVPLATPVRTATFVVERPADSGTMHRYEVTNDFETGVSRMLVDRLTLPDIEVLAVFDTANLREADRPNWWSMPRGEFPLAGGSETQHWLRTIDEYFPASMRQYVTIDAASESVLGTETMRHLVVTVDAAGLATSAAALAVDPLTGLQVPAVPTTPREFALPTDITGSTEAIEPVTLEIWVDSNGMIRKLVEPSSASGQTVTVTSVSPDAFNPTFPAPEAVSPLTAGELVDLAL